MATRALIIGSAGQDGRLLFERLQQHGTAIVGVTRTGLQLASAADPGLARVDVLDAAQVRSLVEAVRPDEIYYLAACHHSSEDLRPDDLRLYATSHAVHVQGLVHFLEAMRASAPQARLFYAASSHVFGTPATERQDESTPLNPQCIYGITKAAGIHLCRFYRRTHGLYASAGILYNHESPYRRPSFVAQKIVTAAVNVRAGRQRTLVLGDLSAKVDWGWAADYVEAMARVLALPASDDFVIASGVAHTVGEFVEAVFEPLGLDWKAHVVEDPSIITKGRRTLIGDPAKLRRATGWAPTVGLREMARLLLRAQGAYS